MDTVTRLPLPAAYMDPAFLACVLEAASTPELVVQFDRLYGADLGARRAPIERMVDIACGKRNDDISAFMCFVHRSVYMTVGGDVLEDLRTKAQQVLEVDDSLGPATA